MPEATSTAGAPTDERAAIVLAVGATLLAAGLALWQLGDKSLWYDEAWSIGIVDRPAGDAVWRMAHWEVNQSPFFALLAGWWRVGQGETFLRLLPAVFVVLSVPALFQLGRRIADAWVGAVAGLLLACHPLVVQWGQQLRGYSLLVFVTIVATTLLLRACEAPTSTRRAVVYAAVAALATYVHFFAAFVVGAHGLWVLCQRRDRPPRRWFVVVGSLYVGLLVPLLAFFVTREGDPIDWLGRASTTTAIKLTARGLAGGDWGIVAYGLAGAVGVWAAVATARATRDRGARALLPVIWLLVPVVAATLSTVTVKPLLEARFLMGVVPAMALLAAMAVRRLPRAIGVGLLGALLLVSVVQVDHWYDAPGEDWRGATELVADATEPGTEVVIVPWGGVFALRYYESLHGVPAADVVRPEDDGFPTGSHLVEVLRRSGFTDEARVSDEYRAQRDGEYELVDEHALEGLVVRTYDRRGGT